MGADDPQDENDDECHDHHSDAGMIEGDSHILEGERDEDEGAKPKRRGINKGGGGGGGSRVPKNNPAFFKDRETLLEEQRHLRAELNALTRQSSGLKGKVETMTKESNELKQLMGKLNAQVTLANAAHSTGGGYGSGLGSDSSRRSRLASGENSVLALESKVLELRVINKDFKRQYEMMRTAAGSPLLSHASCVPLPTNKF
jgi:hypothetical protein